MKTDKLLKKAAFGAALLFASNAGFAACGNIQIAEMNWGFGRVYGAGGQVHS